MTKEKHYVLKKRRYKQNHRFRNRICWSFYKKQLLIQNYNRKLNHYHWTPESFNLQCHTETSIGDLRGKGAEILYFLLKISCTHSWNIRHTLRFLLYIMLLNLLQVTMNWPSHPRSTTFLKRASKEVSRHELTDNTHSPSYHYLVVDRGQRVAGLLPINVSVILMTYVRTTSFTFHKSHPHVLEYFVLFSRKEKVVNELQT